MSEIGLQGADVLARKALANGGELQSFGSVLWDVSADCERAAGVTVTGSHFRGMYNVPEGGFTVLHGRVKRYPRPKAVHLQVRCGKCARCRRLRRRVWTARAVSETRQSVRTWLCTLTASPEDHYRYICGASRRGERAGFEFDTLADDEKFRELCKEMGSDLTNFVKRIRKQSGAKLRAMWVFEAHKSGAPHIHGLLHEVEGSISWRELDRQWTAGFSRFNVLTDPAKSAYAAKYLAKEASCRVRASLRYGQARS